MVSHLTESLAEMPLVQPEGGHLDEDRGDVRVDHLFEQLGLVASPQIAEGHQLETRATGGMRQNICV